MVGLPKKTLKKLQQTQYSAAHLIMRTGRRQHMKPVIKDLHWLPISERIKFKILVLTYKTLHGEGPGYLSDLLKRHVPDHRLRNKRQERLIVPKYRLETRGPRGFKWVAPNLWNSVPDSVKESKTVAVFKKRLKTHLFKNCF